MLHIYKKGHNASNRGERSESFDLTCYTTILNKVLNMGTMSFNKEILYVAEKLNYVKNMAEDCQIQALKEVIPLLVLEQAKLEQKADLSL